MLLDRCLEREVVVCLDLVSWREVLLWVRGEDFLDVVRERCVRSVWSSCGRVGSGAGMEGGGSGGCGASAGGGGAATGGGRGAGLG